MDVEVLLLEAFQASGAEEGLTYVSVPITSGLRELRLLKTLDCTRDELRRNFAGQFQTDVIEPNEREAKVFAVVAKILFPHDVVVEPARLHVPGWTQDEYSALWSQLIRRYALRLVTAPLWAFSIGARDEVSFAVRLGVPIYTITGQRLSGDEVLAQDVEARRKLQLESWAPVEIDAHLPPLSLSPPAESLGDRRDVVESSQGASEVLGLLYLERARLLESSGVTSEDRRTQVKPEEWFTRIERHLESLGASGLHSRRGQRALEDLARTASAYLESSVRCFGPLPRPATATGRRVRLPKVHSERPLPISAQEALGEVFSWLVGERHYQLHKYGIAGDDHHTRQGFNKWWRKQLHRHYHRARELTPRTLLGRQALAKFLATVSALIDSASRVFGYSPFSRP